MSDRNIPLYAVLFKIHFWDDFVARRFVALQARCPGADLWIAVDETNGPINDIPYDKIFRTRDSDMHLLGLPAIPAVRLNWYNVDYQLLAFHRAHDGYPFYVMVEYDAVVQCDLDALALDSLRRKVDLIAFPIPIPLDVWYWTHTLESVWSRQKIQHQLLCIAGFSQRAVAHLLMVRLNHSVRYAQGQLTHWPFSEGFVPTALHTAGFNLESLTDFGPTECYDWWPPYHESDLPNLENQAFIHPVLTGRRYVESLLRYSQPETYLTAQGSVLRRQLDRESPHIVLPSLIEALIREKDITSLVALRQSIDSPRGGNINVSLVPLLASLSLSEAPHNLALHKYATQSSVSDWSRDPTNAGDAANAVNGLISGDYGFHTSQEIQPWWMVDLDQPCLIAEIRIYNRLTSGPCISARANNLSVWSSGSGRDWELLHRRATDTPFGGADGNPLIVPFVVPVVARFVRVECDGLAILHLDEVEIIGVTYRAAAPPRPIDAAPPIFHQEPIPRHLAASSWLRRCSRAWRTICARFRS